MNEFLIVYDDYKSSLARSLSNIMKIKAVPLKIEKDDVGRVRVKVELEEAKRFIYLGGFYVPYDESLTKNVLALSTLSDRGVVEAAVISPLPFHKSTKPVEISFFSQMVRTLWGAKKFITFDLVPPEKLGYFRAEAVSLSAFPFLTEYVLNKWKSATVKALDRELDAIVEAMRLRLKENGVKLLLDVEVISSDFLDEEVFRSSKEGKVLFTTHLLTEPEPILERVEELITTNLVECKKLKGLKVLDVAPAIKEYLGLLML